MLKEIKKKTTKNQAVNVKRNKEETNYKLQSLLL